MTQHLPARWHDHRDVAETIAQGAADAISAITGSITELSTVSSFDPAPMLSERPTPIRAVVVELRAPLTDALILISPLNDADLREYAAMAATGAIEALGAAGGDEPAWEITSSHEYDSTDFAIDQCDALYLEATYELSVPVADLRLVLGSSLLECATRFRNGEVEPAALAKATRAAGDAGDEVPMLVVEPATAGAAGPGTLELGGMSALEALDAELAAEEAAAVPAPRSVAPASPIAATAAANVASAAPGGALEPGAAAEYASGQQWASLLSGVEVELSAELGRTNLPLGDITSLHSQSVLTLDQLVHEPVTVYVNGTVYARARLVVVDGEYGIEIIEVVEQRTAAVTMLAA